MNKLEEMFLTQGVVWDDDVQICTEIVQEVAIKYRDFWLKEEVKWFDNTEEGAVYKDKKGRKITENQLFKIFVQTL